MALRVLLADESATIKKVFQLALQDYAVEVVTVNVGVDVAPVTEKIKPDVIFADVLLQKKNGYDVSAELKANPRFKDIPVVLIWSGFMELDEDKFQASGANAHLEKPFDAKKLRELIQNLVPKTKTQPLSDFLTFPDMPEFEEKKKHQVEEAALPVNESSSKWNMEQFDAIEKMPLPGDEDFTEVNIPKNNQHVAQSDDDEIIDIAEEDDDNQWVQKPISDYRLDIDPDSESSDLVDVNYEIPEETTTTSSIQNFSQEEAPDDDELTLETDPAIVTPTAVISSQLTQQRLEEIVRQEVRKIVDDVVWKVVPELAQQLIQKEINRLLTDEETLHD